MMIKNKKLKIAPKFSWTNDALNTMGECAIISRAMRPGFNSDV